MSAALACFCRCRRWFLCFCCWACGWRWCGAADVAEAEVEEAEADEAEPEEAEVEALLPLLLRAMPPSLFIDSSTQPVVCALPSVPSDRSTLVSPRSLVRKPHVDYEVLIARATCRLLDLGGIPLVVQEASKVHMNIY